MCPIPWHSLSLGVTFAIGFGGLLPTVATRFGVGFGCNRPPAAPGRTERVSASVPVVRRASVVPLQACARGRMRFRCGGKRCHWDPLLVEAFDEVAAWPDAVDLDELLSQELRVLGDVCGLRPITAHFGVSLRWLRGDEHGRVWERVSHVSTPFPLRFGLRRGCGSRSRWRGGSRHAEHWARIQGRSRSRCGVDGAGKETR